MSIDYQEKIPNNVNLNDDRRLQRALEKWQPGYQQWWSELGPEASQNMDVYLRTAISVEPGGWANYGHVKMPDYRWGIFLSPAEEGRVISFGAHKGEPAWQEIPAEYRSELRRLIVTQGDTEPASVEQQRQLGLTCPSLYDLRNLFQVNVEEGRHLWAMVYLLHAHFGRDGRNEADALLERRSGDVDKPRILDAFNQPCPDWLTFFCFTMFTDRDGKYQLGSLAESAFDPLSRTCKFMLTEEAHHLSVGELGLDRVIRRAAELMKKDPNEDVRNQGGIDLPTVQKWINHWFCYSLDLFGSEISSNGAHYFAGGLKGRWREAADYTEHSALDQIYNMKVVENGRLSTQDVPLRNAMNEVLRDDYVKDCERVLARWNRTLEKEDVSFRLSLPSTRFFRRQGIYTDHAFDLSGNLISQARYDKNVADWLPTEADREYVNSLMTPVTEPGKMANWIGTPRRGINRQPTDFDYVRM